MSQKPGIVDHGQWSVATWTK